jgi:hypothetical protein
VLISAPDRSTAFGCLKNEPYESLTRELCKSHAGGDNGVTEGSTVMKSKLSAMLAISGAIVILSAYSAKAGFITLADFDSSAVVSDLNNLGPAPLRKRGVE